jgi:signal transduction histidine kinase
VLIRKSEIERLSVDIRKLIDGQAVDIRDNSEGVWKILKNDIHTLASLKNEQVDVLQQERVLMKDSLTNISHQIKTPLTSMLLMADLLENSPPDKQAEFIENIKAGLMRLDWLSSVLLKMAKLDAGAVEFAKTSIQAKTLIEPALEPLQILLDVNNQSIVLSGDIKLFCDKQWTAEALSNIIKNASEYSPTHSVIKIDCGENPICSWISVTDSGAGIANTDIPKLFKRFEGSRSDKGFGVGLPLALAIMRGQGGDIEVEKSTFTLKFYESDTERTNTT